MTDKHQTIKKFDSTAFALAGGIGPWIAPIAPALVFGSAFSTSLWLELGWLAVAGGIVAGVGLVVAGAFASHNAIERGGGWWFAAIAYVALEIGGLWAMTIDFNMQVVGTVLALITFIVYISRAGASQISESKAKAEQTEADRLAFERQRILAEDQRKHERALKLDELQTQASIEAERERTKATGLQADADAKLERARLERERLALRAKQEQAEAEAKRRRAEQEQAEAEANRILCDGCEREFKTQQALNAHKQFCASIQADASAAHANGSGNKAG